MSDPITLNSTCLVDEKTAAQLIGMSVPWLRLMRQQGSTTRVKALPYVRLGRAIRYETNALRDFVESHRVVR